MGSWQTRCGGSRSPRNHRFKAEPGAGKATRFPLGLAEAPGIGGTIIVVQPRRIAARMPHYVAERVGSKVGETIGYRVRFDTKAGATRLLFVTEGMLLDAGRRTSAG